MKIPTCKCGWMLASRTVRSYSADDGQVSIGENICWVCVNKDCEESRPGRLVQPVWLEVAVVRT